MQSIVSSCAVNIASNFVQGVKPNSIAWASISPMAGGNIHAFGKSTQQAGAQQILGVNQNGKSVFVYISQPITFSNILNILSKDNITSAQVGSSMTKAATSVGSGGFINMAVVSLPAASAAAKDSTLCCCVNGQCTADKCKKLGTSCGTGGQCVQSNLCGAAPPQPSPTVLTPLSLGVSAQSLLMPMCAGQVNWISVGSYGVLVVLLLLLWSWLA